MLLSATASAIDTVNATHCNSGQFYCGAGSTFFRCIPNSWVCDGDRDCSNNADEANCGMYYVFLYVYHFTCVPSCRNYFLMQ